METRINRTVLVLVGVAVVYGGIVGSYFIGKKVRAKTEPAPEFTLYTVPSKSDTGSQGVEMYKVVGQGRTCYIAGFGVSKVLLWCENGTPSTGEIKGWNCDASKLEWMAKQEQEH